MDGREVSTEATAPAAPVVVVARKSLPAPAETEAASVPPRQEPPLTNGEGHSLVEEMEVAEAQQDEEAEDSVNDKDEEKEEKKQDEETGKADENGTAENGDQDSRDCENCQDPVEERPATTEESEMPDAPVTPGDKDAPAPAAALSQGESPAAAPEAPPVKRGRGRPRKIYTDEHGRVIPKPTPSPSARGRGGTGRPRGRPRGSGGGGRGRGSPRTQV